MSDLETRDDIDAEGTLVLDGRRDREGMVEVALVGIAAIEEVRPDMDRVLRPTTMIKCN